MFPIDSPLPLPTRKRQQPIHLFLNVLPSGDGRSVFCTFALGAFLGTSLTLILLSTGIVPVIQNNKKVQVFFPLCTLFKHAEAILRHCKKGSCCASARSTAEYYLISTQGDEFIRSCGTVLFSSIQMGRS